MTDSKPTMLISVTAAAIVLFGGAMAWVIVGADGAATGGADDGNETISAEVNEQRDIEVSEEGERVAIGLDDPALRLAFRGPQGNRSHVIRIRDLPTSQHRCVRLVHPGLPEDATFMADLTDQTIRADDDTDAGASASETSITGRRVSADHAQACSDAAWRAHRLGTHITAFTLEFAKLHPDSNRTDASERAKELLTE